MREMLGARSDAHCMRAVYQMVRKSKTDPSTAHHGILRIQSDGTSGFHRSDVWTADETSLVAGAGTLALTNVVEHEGARGNEKGGGGGGDSREKRGSGASEKEQMPSRPSRDALVSRPSHVHFGTEQAEVHEIPSSYIGSDSDEDAGIFKGLNSDGGTQYSTSSCPAEDLDSPLAAAATRDTVVKQLSPECDPAGPKSTRRSIAIEEQAEVHEIPASLICGDSDEDDTKGNTDALESDKTPATTTARSLIDLDGSLIHDGIRTRMRCSTRGAGQDASNASRAQGATRHRSPPPICLGSPPPSNPLSIFEPSDEDAATSDEGPGKQDEEDREKPMLGRSSHSVDRTLGTRLGLEGLEGGGMGESAKGGFNQSCRLSGKMLSKGVIEDVYPPFDAQVERFVKVSGGGHGVYFGEHNIFALGVIKRSVSKYHQRWKSSGTSNNLLLGASTKWLKEPRFSTSKGARVQEYKGEKNSGSAAGGVFFYFWFYSVLILFFISIVFFRQRCC
jgi:hypothetical protein